MVYCNNADTWSWVQIPSSIEAQEVLNTEIFDPYVFKTIGSSNLKKLVIMDN